MNDYRNVSALILAVGLLQLGGGILGVVTPLGLGEIGLTPVWIGAIGALHAAGFMAGAWAAPRVILAVGHIRVFSAGAALTAAGTLMMGIETTAPVWSLVRLAHGFGFAWLFASAESWLSVATPRDARGGVLGLYHVVAKVALLSGPFLVLSAAPLSAEPYLWAGFFLALALLPVCLTRRVEPARHGGKAMMPRTLLAIAPAAFWAVLIAGIVNTGTLALLPVYAQEIASGIDGLSAPAAAATAMAAAWLGGIASQWPAGRLSDRIDRRLVIAGMGAIAAGAALLLFLVGGFLPVGLVLLLLALWGAGSLSFYGIAIAHGVDRTAETEAAQLMAGLLFVWAFGSVLGPVLAGLAMATPAGPSGLFALAGLLTLLLVFTMLWRRGRRGAVPEGERSDWEMTRPTSLGTVDIDPRSESQPTA